MRFVGEKGEWSCNKSLVTTSSAMRVTRAVAEKVSSWPISGESLLTTEEAAALSDSAFLFNSRHAREAGLAPKTVFR